MLKTLFRNGHILTGEDLLSPTPQYVSSLLVENGEVLAAGDDLPADGAAVIDLGGAFVMPGFNDAHLHLGEGARRLREVELTGTRSLDEMLARIAQARQATSPGSWIVGSGWDESLWPTSTLPTRHDLDRATGDHPACFGRIDIHIAVANSAALRAAGLDRNCSNPANGSLGRDATGDLNGLLQEAAARELVMRHVPPASHTARVKSLRQVLADAVRHGITSVQDNSVDEDVVALQQLHSSGELPLRISEWLPFDTPLAELRQRRDSFPNDRMLRAGMLKAFLDGSLGSRTAAMLAPYADAPGESGIPLYRETDLIHLAMERAAAGFQLGFHAIGDLALAMGLTALAAAGGHRSRIEHAQTAAPEAFAQARSAGVIASIQPAHLLSDLRWVGERLGPDRTGRSYAWRSFAEAGVPLAFGTDYPVEPLSPFPGLYAAVARQSAPTAPAYHPEQRLTPAEALHAATQGAAFAEGTESWKGKLVPGYVADFAVLDRNPLRVAADELHGMQVLRTVVGGRTVFQA